MSHNNEDLSMTNEDASTKMYVEPTTDEGIKKEKEELGNLYTSKTDLLIRHKVLNILRLTRIDQDSSPSDKDIENNLITTDLFVEYDIQTLTKRAIGHSRKGNLYFYLAVLIFSTGVVFSFSQVFELWGTSSVDMMNDTEYPALITSLIRTFTAYGLLVLTGVTLWKQSKAQLDQAERIFEKRRSNRILRLFVHLNSGVIELDEMQRILQWGTTNANAFSSLETNAQAPVGKLIADVSKMSNSVNLKKTDNK